MFYIAFGKEHSERLPTVRIAKITINNLKDVRSGTVDFACSKAFVEEGTRSDILGVYGQNGSGKTTLIQTIELVKRLLSGRPMKPSYADMISVESETAAIEICFDFQYPNLDVRKVFYSFEFGKTPLSDDLKPNFSNMFGEEVVKRIDCVPTLISEKVEVSGLFNGKKIKRQVVISVDKDGKYTPETKIQSFFRTPNLNSASNDLYLNNVMARRDSKSILFSNELISMLVFDTNSSNYCEILKELQLFAINYLFTFTSESNVYVRGNFALPIYTENNSFWVDTTKPNIVSKDFFFDFKNDIEKVSSVLCKWIPGLELTFINVFETKDEKGRDAISFELASKRGSIILPIRYEADGVRKIIMYLKLLITAFNEKSTTIAIDELDAGVFEFLLGEILELFERHGKGQLVFTSHNLRPLEVLDKKFLCFTTSNPYNRYVRMKSVGHTNNLRLLYLKEIMLGGTQEEQLYKKEKEFAILGAIKKCSADE